MIDQTLTLTLAVAGLLLVGCGEREPERTQDASDAKAHESGPGKLAHDSEATFAPYRPENMTGLTALGVEIIKQGEGPLIEEGATLDVHYKGMLMDGKVFGQSDRSKSPLTVVLKHPGGVIEGWVQGLVRQCQGTVLKLSVPARLAYGTKGRPPAIPPDSDLIFEVEIMRVHQ